MAIRLLSNLQWGVPGKFSVATTLTVKSQSLLSQLPDCLVLHTPLTRLVYLGEDMRVAI